MFLKNFVKNDKKVTFFVKNLGLGLGWATGLGLGWLTWSRSRSRYTSGLGLGLGKEILVSVDPCCVTYSAKCFDLLCNSKFCSVNFT